MTKTTRENLAVLPSTGSTSEGTSIALAPRTRDATNLLSHLVDEVGVGLLRTRHLVEDGVDLLGDWDQLHVESLVELHRTRTAARSQEPMSALLAQIGALGFAWSDVARIVGVSVPALRKWRTGGSATGPNKRRVAELVAVADLVAEKYMIEDVVGWLAVPLSDEASTSALDMLSDGRRYDLVLAYASGKDSETILDDFRPGWRADLASDPFEVFTADDGMPAIRFREGE